MSVAINNLINFSRALPAPMDTLSSKKVKVSSKYGSGTEATLTATVIKAVHAVCDCMTGSAEGAVGVIDHRMVAEYKSSSGPDAYHLVVYDSASGNIVASGYDKNTEMIETYRLHQTANDGAAVLMAMFPALIADQEFEDNFVLYFDQRKAGYTDLTKAVEYMAILCDNAYRRLKDETCPANIKAKIEKSGNVLRVSQAQLDSGAYTPSNVMAGEFTIFAKTGRATVSAAKTEIPHTDFEGKYQLTSGRKLSILEESLVPKLDSWYIIPEQVVNICRHAQVTTGKPMQMRNFLMRGPAGTGKTQGARAIAAGLHLPYMKYTCSASTEVFDFVGMVFPKTDSMTTGDAQLDKEREMVMAMGGINYANVAKIMNLPDLEDMDFDPCGVFQSLTGITNEEATSRDCMAVVMDRVAEKIKQLSKPAEGDPYRKLHFCRSPSAEKGWRLREGAGSAVCPVLRFCCQTSDPSGDRTAVSCQCHDPDLQKVLSSEERGTGSNRHVRSVLWRRNSNRPRCLHGSAGDSLADESQSLSGSKDALCRREHGAGSDHPLE